MNQPKTESPFHQGEKAIQQKLGVDKKMDAFARRVVRDHMPEQHQEFYQQLPFIFAGHIDNDGWPWASFLYGEKGFIHSPENTSLIFTTQTIEGDPIQKSLSEGLNIGLLGIELPTRRRNRLSTVVSNVNNNGFSLKVRQSFGNCPQYIQSREIEKVEHKEPAEIIPITHLNDDLKAFISNSDTFFVASFYQNEDGKEHDSNGADVSHRGGKPGFIRVDNDQQLTIPDYLGNFHFNTLGNFLLNPKAGLLFIDFEQGHILTLTGTVEIIWQDDDLQYFDGAERLWTFKLNHGFLLKHALPYRWAFKDYSPSSEITGTWQAAQQRKQAEQQRNEWKTCIVKNIVKESELVNSYYLQVQPNEKLPFKAGQFLTVKTPINGTDVIRTYTVSNAPADSDYRISVKQESHGVFSKHLHQTVQIGDTLQYKAPAGSFFIEPEVKRPAVLLAAGIGITPMISMMRHILLDSLRTRSIRPITLICAVKNKAQRSFYQELTRLVEQSSGSFQVFWVFSSPEEDTKPGIDYHHKGHISAELLQAILPIDDYDFYLCGPSGFMQAMYDLCLLLGINDHRVFAESFGPASLTRQQVLNHNKQALLPPAENAIVDFAQSAFEQAWSSEDGNLLTFAESHGLSPEHGCRNGQCGSCKVKLLSGEVTYEHPPSCEYESDEVVLCCAIPAKNNEQTNDNIISTLSVAL